MSRLGSRLALVLLAASGGCANAPAAGTRVAPDEEFRLSVGQSADLQGQALAISFEGVESDSRCPKGEACVWEGDAAVRVMITSGSRSEERVLHTSAKGGPKAAGYEGWTVELVALEPPPVKGRNTAPEYVATLRLTRGAPVEAATQ
jgi:hypothetical protein